MAKHVFVTGGVVSSLGKGITAASLGRLLKSRGYRVSMQKLDPYLNVDPGMMSPLQHGEVYVTDDGTECDLDLGHYERFIDERLTGLSTVSAGKIYWTVLMREREGGYNGGTLQVIPSITDEVKKRISDLSEDADIVITEIGGTVGDIEVQPFLEAIRQFGWDIGQQNVCYLHVTLLPYVQAADEVKTKPSQHSVASLRSTGIQPNAIVCRTEKPITTQVRDKLALFCNVKPSAIIINRDVDLLYDLPLALEEEGLARVVLEQFGLPDAPADLAEWRALTERARHTSRTVRIALVGKYVKLRDAYLSVCEALKHACMQHGVGLDIRWVEAENLTDENAKMVLSGCDGILIGAGFGDRGAEGKMAAAAFARANRYPMLSLGFGMQLAVVEFARSVMGLADANTTELDPETPHPVVGLTPEQLATRSGEGTMRLGAHTTQLREGSLMRAAYGSETTYERHRHRYEINPAYLDAMERAGMKATGIDQELGFADAVELADHPFFVGVQYHPEYTSRPNRPSPLFCAFIGAALREKE